eukprot:CAMPEP_0168596990 /NCGR_PEP_ID=MMETSP0420-20121227/10349_1 /TAXON_ID=498008 /ORGANISM="Pessonella sp." /LENGTH=57 /DNA_ID=CAMNT_0008633659 /DNA_START=166 /DNA_END=336 /DNA_ORIENTATION=-
MAASTMATIANTDKFVEDDISAAGGAMELVLRESFFKTISEVDMNDDVDDNNDDVDD